MSKPLFTAEETLQAIQYGRNLANKVQLQEQEIAQKDELIANLNQQIIQYIEDKRQYSRVMQKSANASIMNLPATVVSSPEKESKPLTPRGDVNNRSPTSMSRDTQWQISQLRTELERAQEDIEFNKQKWEIYSKKEAEEREKNEKLNLALEISRDREEKLNEQLEDAKRTIIIINDDKRKLTRANESLQEEAKQHVETLQNEFKTDCKIDAHQRLSLENIALQNSIEELTRILSETRAELQEFRQHTGSPSAVKVKQEEKLETSFNEEWNQLLVDKFEFALQELMDKITHNERRNMLGKLSPRTNEKVKESYFQDYFAMLVLSIKVLLSKEDRYRHVWHHIWFEDKNELYEQCLNDGIEYHNWWIYIFSKITASLEDAIEEMYSSYDSQDLRRTL